MSKYREKREQRQAIAAAKAHKSGPIPTAQVPPVTEFVTFSFKYLYYTDKFCLERGPDTFPAALLERLKAISSMPFSEFRQPPGNPKALRSHAIDFSRTSEKAGFSQLSTQLWPTPWQFEISQACGRVHGFLAGENVFCVVWLDPTHALYA